MGSRHGPSLAHSDEGTTTARRRTRPATRGPIHCAQASSINNQRPSLAHSDEGPPRLESKQRPRLTLLEKTRKHASDRSDGHAYALSEKRDANLHFRLRFHKVEDVIQCISQEMPPTLTFCNDVTSLNALLRKVTQIQRFH